MSGTTYYQRNREVILNRAKRYYDNIEVLREKAKNKYRELSEEEKNIKREYGRNRYNMSEEKKQRLKEYQKNYCEAKKHRCRYGNKGTFQNWYHKDIFWNHSFSRKGPINSASSVHWSVCSFVRNADMSGFAPEVFDTLHKVRTA